MYILMLIPVIIIALAILYFYPSYQFFSFKYHKFTIIGFLETKKLVLIELRSLTRYEVSRNPFKTKDSSVLFGSMLFNTLYKHKIVVVLNSKHKQKIFWLRVSKSFFSKEKIETIAFNPKESKKALSELNNIILIKDNCPACGENIVKSDIICPQCELNFGS